MNIKNNYPLFLSLLFERVNFAQVGVCTLISFSTFHIDETKDKP